MTDASMDRERALSAHIRAQLLEYVNEHINIDHIAYSEHIATQVNAGSCFMLGRH